MKARSEKPPPRITIEGVSPAVDGGRYPVKRIAGDLFTVEVDLLADGHDELAARLCYHHENEPKLNEVAFAPLGNDRWRAAFALEHLGVYLYSMQAWVDEFATWLAQLRKRIAAGVEVSAELAIGARLVSGAATRARGAAKERLRGWAKTLGAEALELASRLEVATEAGLAAAMAEYPDRSRATTGAELQVVVDRPRARSSAWYELFPRSTSPTAGRHGTLEDCVARLAYVAELGFDVVYLPPIHPIGTSFRKGKNNTTTCEPGEPGSPWAIGSEAGGHTAVHPELGSLADFRNFVTEAGRRGLEVALDLAFQCSPDHPYVREHPEWFRHRPDGTIQYAENPPKKYQDIYPLDFDSVAWRSLWDELLRVVEFWIKQGVAIFRVDNPHTKPFAFWEWLIAEVKQRHPEVIFLAEAFTRPKIMQGLAKLGFTQSYTYFTWRNSKGELQEYFTELTRPPLADFFRPNLWPNTPDILHATLQTGERPAFMIRFLLAATLGANYGIYGPAFELCINTPREAGSEEYLDAEKYELKHWDLEASDSLRELIATTNRIRRAHPALGRDDTLRFHAVENEALICYSKTFGTDVILVVVSLDPAAKQAGVVNLDLQALGVDPEHPFTVHDLLTGNRYTWQGPRNYVELDARQRPAHLFVVGP